MLVLRTILEKIQESLFELSIDQLVDIFYPQKYVFAYLYMITMLRVEYRKINFS